MYFRVLDFFFIIFVFLLFIVKKGEGIIVFWVIRIENKGTIAVAILARAAKGWETLSCLWCVKAQSLLVQFDPNLQGIYS